MEANARQARFLQQRFEPPVCRSGIHRQVQTGRLRENPLTDGGFFPCPQQCSDALRQDDRAVALARFRVAEGVDALPLAVQRPGDSESPGLRVEVAPHERADLAAPQAGHKLRVEEIPPDIVLLNRLQERVQLLLVQYLHRLVVGFRHSCVLSRIFRNDVRLHRSLHRAVQHRMDVPHGRIGEPLAALRVLAHAPAGFQPPVHPLHVLCRDERNLLAAELRLDVVFDIIPVAFQRPRTNRAVLVFRKPAVQPLAQRHAAVLGQLHVLIAFDALVQLFRQRFLRLRVDVPEDRVAVCLVSHDDAPFPAPIVALPDHPVSGWPPFSHMQGSFPLSLFSNNYHAGDTIATSRAESYQKVIILFSLPMAVQSLFSIHLECFLLPQDLRE